MLSLSKILLAGLASVFLLADISFADPGPCDGKDPYQVVNYANVLKSRLLRRISNDPNRKSDPVFGEATSDPCTSSAMLLSWPYDENVLKSRNADLDAKSYPRGVTLTTSDTTEIKSLFVNIANRIKLKLIT